MAKFKKIIDAESNAIAKAHGALESAALAPQYAHLFSDKEAATFLGLESLTDTQQASFESHMSDVGNFLSQHVVSELEAVYGKLPEHSLEAAQIVLAAAADPVGYNTAQTKVREAGKAGRMNMELLANGQAGALQIAADQNMSMESFDEKELNKYMNYSIIFNVLASRQDEFNEGFYQALSVTPDEVGYRVSVRLENVWSGMEHAPNGDATAVVKRNLIDALVHPEVLETNATDVIPYLQDTGDIKLKNDHHFYEPTDANLTSVEFVEDLPVKTGWLKVNMRHNLLGLSSHPALISAELMNEKDSLDSRLALAKVLLKVDAQHVEYDVKLLHTAGFFKSAEGHMREMALQFRNKSFLATTAAKAVDGADVTAFKDATDAKYDIRLELRLNGSAEVDSSNVEVNPAPVRIASVRKDGKEIPFDRVSLQDPANAQLKTLIEKLEKAEIVAVKFEARRTNYNLRTRGRMIDSTEYAEQVTIPLRAPISIIKPVVGGDKEHPDVAALVNAARIQANNDGVATILNLGRLLQQITSRENYSWAADRDSFPGIGRHFINPCYLYAQWHLPTMVNSVQSQYRLEDIQGAVVTAMNELVGRVLKVTNYIPVVEQMTGGNPGEVEVVIGTDYRLPQYIVTKGDTRLFGGKVNYKIVRTPNKLMSNKVVATITRKAAEAGPDPFSFGTFVWTPELMVSQTITKMNSTYITHMVQPRYLHIVNVPILIEIDVTGIEEVTNESTVLFTSPVDKDEVAKVGNEQKAPAPSQVTPVNNVKPGK